MTTTASWRFVPVESGKMHQIEPDSWVWNPSGPADGSIGIGVEAGDVKFVVLRPPRDVAPARLAFLKEGFERIGARVVVQQQNASRVVLEKGKDPARVSAGARETVLRMAEQANSADRDKLLANCERVLAKVGL